MADNTKPIPPVPNKSDLLEPITGTDPKKFSRKMSVVWVRWMIQLRDKINLINATIASLSGFSGSGFISSDGTGSVNGRTIQGTTSDITITNGDGIAGNPVISSAATGVTPGSYTNTNLTVGADGKLTAAASGSAAGSPLTTKGDLFGFDTADARVPVGTNGYVLTADSTSPTGVSYQPPGTPTLPVTTKGDILGYSTIPARVPVGTDGYVLTADSTDPLGVSYKPISSPAVTSDNFSPPDPYNYTQFYDSPSTANFLPGVLTINATSASDQSVFCRNGVFVADASISVSLTNSYDGGLVLRLTDSSNYYLLAIHDSSFSSPNKLIIYKRVAGTFTQIGIGSISFTAGTSHTCGFSATGTSLIATFDSTTIISITDSAITSAGWVGIRHNDTTASIYNSFSW